MVRAPFSHFFGTAPYVTMVYKKYSNQILQSDHTASPQKASEGLIFVTSHADAGDLGEC